MLLQQTFKFADAPWSYECRKLLPIWDELGEKYQSHEDVIIAKIDVTANDVLSVVMDRYPFFRLFPAGPDIQVRNLGGCHSCMLMGVFRIEAHPLSKALLFIYSTLSSLSTRIWIKGETLPLSLKCEVVARAFTLFTIWDLTTALFSAV